MKATRCFIVAGLGYGDEGKGSIVDYLVRRYGASAVARYNGGPQAAHHVVLPDGRWHCFSQFGAGAFVESVSTHLSSRMLIKPANLLAEAEALRMKGVGDVIGRLSIDPTCRIVAPFHAMIGQMLEVARGGDRLGSVGMGVGQAVADWREKGDEALHLADTFDEKRLEHKIQALWQEKLGKAREIMDADRTPALEAVYQDFTGRIDPKGLAASYLQFRSALERAIVPDERRLADLFGQGQSVVLEGAQGALLDPVVGFSPYVTKTGATCHEADELLGGWARRVEVRRIGVARAYACRHGPGPFVTEDADLERVLPEMHNARNPWQGRMRVGWLDLVALRYSLAVNGHVDTVALTCLDRLAGIDTVRVCSAYEYVGQDLQGLDEQFEWDRRGDGRARITAIRPPLPSTRSGSLANLLMDCRPLEAIEFPGWGEDVPLPRAARDYVEFLESRQGLGIPVSIVSVGPTAWHKLTGPGWGNLHALQREGERAPEV